ncbi:MAG: folylpolyglutamate synthase/dihydrofolate synthase family protein [bacterium]|nr:folylpolyglutamate synthase/dihydrofolate synthase family protein [bacterium]
MTYEESLEYIHSIPKFRRPLGNAQLARLLGAAGNPQDKLSVIHIAGTNGKGSTAAMLSEILKRQGYKTGMFTSPFIEVFNERIQINKELIPDSDLAEYTERIKRLMDENEAYVSEFAFITAVAFLYFYEKGCDYVVLETGMGGRLDATNIVKKPKLCILTSISLDHMQFLGDTIEKIAEEKCGIIKRGVPVVSYGNEAVKGIIEAAAEEKGSELVFPSESVIADGGFVYEGKQYKLSLKGGYQVKNAALVIKACEMLNKYGIAVSDKAAAEGLEHTTWPVRYEFIRDNLVIDGGHNIDGVRELVKSLKADGRKIYAVTAMMSDKSMEECISEIALCAERIYCTELDMPRCGSAEELASIAEKSGKTAVVVKNPVDAVKAALAEADSDTLVAVCGSLYLAGEVRKYYR